jgi:serine/threonine-protein phosphatase 2A regulatory subunit A
MTDNKTNPAELTRVTAQLYPIAVLIDELKCQDQKKRITAVKNLSTISVALGPERTRNELLPYILELLDDDEEVLIVLAESLGSLLTCCGGPAHAEHLLRVLEKLCGIEESSVREKVSLTPDLICFIGY